MKLDPEKPFRRIMRRMRDRYRLVFINDGTFEEKFSLKMTRWNLLTGLLAGIILLFMFAFLIISNTGLRYWISGYTDISQERLLYITQLKLDSQEQVMQQYDLWLQNFQKVIQGEEIEDPWKDTGTTTSRNYDTIQLRRSPEDSVLRAAYSQVDPYSISRKGRLSPSQGFIFFPPLKGTVISGFNPSTRHFAVDIAARENEAIKATLSGTVIMAGWSSETGWTIILQHADNMMSAYKHNSALLKKQGDYVKAGDPIAIYGGTGILTTGRHLHFELWHHGNPVNPQDYMVFD
ncbi:MAG TPA: M23 family metallopeptidase [Bacteroidales bacterium]|nr:M23 family metallopeptidase [Bacteroidales bacterium]HRZ48413.1 M23 family metallopeptidase [Bacteroidales bacterium]